MTLSSMTGFARASGHHLAATFAWEIKSVNGKAFDARLRLPPGREQLEAPARAALQAAFKRGSLQANLALSQAETAGRISLNEAVLGQYLTVAKSLRKKLKAKMPSIESLLAMRGVVEVETAKSDEVAEAALDKAILATLDGAIKSLTTARAREGESLTKIVSSQIDQIERLHAAATSSPARKPEAIKAKLGAQIAELMAIGKFDEQRLTQEAVLLATKADIKEELDRLGVHIGAARELLKTREPVGRKFDFLAQEFNREANTLCSKANDSGLTSIGLELKTVIDQMREQVQNIE